jgi:trans-aconitate 2-methyltransferase
MDWDPDTYQTFRRERELALADLLSHLPPRTPGMIVDLGCGTGTSTSWLARRFPDATIIAVDPSPRMLDHARLRGLRAVWREGAIETFDIPDATEMVFANGSLHRAPAHRTLLPRLVRAMGVGGVLAVQMPYNHQDPCHSILLDVAREGPWRQALAGIEEAGSPVLELAEYRGLLDPICTSVCAWETVYLHRLTGPAPVLEWMRPSLRSITSSRLAEDLAAGFLEELSRAYARAYPPDPTGATLFPVRRRYIVAEAA